jgi:predicted ATPase
LVLMRGSDPGPSSLAYQACCLWCLGYPDQAVAKSQEALVLARQLKHPFSLADVVCFAGCEFSAMRRDVPALKAYSEEQLRLANKNGMPTWLGMAIWRHGQAMAMLGQIQEGIAQIREGQAVCQATDVRLYLPGALCALAEVQAEAGQPGEGLATLADALALVEETDERHWEAELYRIQAELLNEQEDEVGAEASFQKAIAVACRQDAKSWELRAATGLARMWQKQGKRDEAREMLAPIYRWFTEGFDTQDLIEARKLLDALS